MADSTDTEQVTPELRIRRIIGQMPGAYSVSVPDHDATIGEVLDALEAALEATTEVVQKLSDQADQYHMLRADVAAMRRVLGTAPGIDL